uniref:3-ketoacyl-[acyl-carrier-protein] reductase beta subunit n=1 Tax=Jaculus jaculus TaxID=51337 RepID=A0A8C5KQL3_JACJA
MDKVGAIFGGSRGIGKAVAKLMAQKGYRLAIVARDLEVAKAAAGELGDSLLVRTKMEDMLSQLQTNLVGSMLTCKVAVRTMLQRQGGSIVNIGSIIGLKGNSGQCVYSASKGGLVGFSRALAKEVARKKIRVNVVAPGFVHTDMTKNLNEEQLKKNIPLGRFGDPTEVAHAVVFLLESPYVTGHVLVVDGGLQLVI